MISILVPRAFRARYASLAMLVAVATLAVFLLGVLPSPASARTMTVAAGYTAVASGCGETLGQADKYGIFYTTCGGTLRRYKADGTRDAVAYPDVALNAAMGLAYNPIDVAPSPDGTYIYLEQYQYPVVRLVRNLKTYVPDPTWNIDKVPYANQNWVANGRQVHTDGRGDLYVSIGSNWVSNLVAAPSVIAKFTPNGKFITSFGDYGPEPGNWITNMGLAVSRDGRRVFVGENCGTDCIGANGDGSRVTRYDYTAGGIYRYSRVLSTLKVNNGGLTPGCNTAGSTLSAYAVSMDYAENLYVTSTTCGKIQMFSTDPAPAKDKFVKTIGTNADNNEGLNALRLHYIGSDWSGRIHTQEWANIISPNILPAVPATLPDVPALPAPDTQAPVVTAFTLPATTTTQDITVAITATDNTAVSEMRLSNEDGNWGPWQPFQTPVIHRLSNGYSIKGVYLQVRDMADNMSTTQYKTLLYQAAGAGGGGGALDVAVPIIIEVTIPPATLTQTLNIGVRASDDIGVTQMRLANEDGNWSPWGAFADTKAWTLSAGYAVKAVYVQVRDAAGNESLAKLVRTQWVRDAVDIPPPDGGGPADNVPPVLVSLTLPAETTTQMVTVQLNATDNIAVTQVRFANEDGNWTAWQAYAAQKQWQLSAGYSVKLIYAEVRDAKGNTSATALTARTSYVRTVAGPVDAADPLLRTATIPNPTATRVVTVALNATDDVAVTQVRFANEDGTWGNWVAYGANVPHTLTVGNNLLKAVYVQVRDGVGRESNVLVLRTLLQMP